MDRLTLEGLNMHINECKRRIDNISKLLNTVSDANTENCHRNLLALENTVNAIEEYIKIKDLEEQGLLKVFPCNVGDTVWQIMVVGVQGKNIKYGIFKAVVTTISVDYQMNFLLSTITEDEKRYRNEVTSTAIGDTMFFTKSEAEAKLKELEGGENE